MELKIEKQTIGMKQDIKTETQEYAIDSELVLPDYCSDMARILKCNCRPKLKNKQLSVDRLTVEGSVQIELLYVDDQGQIGSYSQQLPLYHEMNLPDSTVFAELAMKTDYCNCRMVSPRKVELHGAITIKSVAQKPQELALICSAEGEGLQTLMGEETVTSLLSVCERMVSVSGEVQVTSGSIRTILRSEAHVQDVEYKGVSGEAIIKAELQVSATYINVEGQIENLRSQIPFTQMIDLNGADDLTDCFITFDVVSLDLRPRTDLDGECKTIMVDAEIAVTAKADQTIETHVVLDAYSTCCGLGIRRCNEPISRLLETLDQDLLTKGNLDLGREAKRIVDLNCEVLSQKSTWNGTTLTIEGQLQVGVLALDQEGVPFYLEKTKDYTMEREMLVSDGNVACQTDVRVCNATFTLTDPNTMEVRIQLHIAAQVYVVYTTDAICEITADLSVVPLAAPAPLVLYYAKAGERLFDIAKRYNTTCQAIAQANGFFDAQIAEPKALLIPAV